MSGLSSSAGQAAEKLERALERLSKAVEANVQRARSHAEDYARKAHHDEVRRLNQQIAEQTRELEAAKHDLRASEEVIVREKRKAEAIQEELNRVHDEHAAITGSYEAELTRLRAMINAPAPAEAGDGQWKDAMRRQLDEAIASLERILQGPEAVR